MYQEQLLQLIEERAQLERLVGENKTRIEQALLLLGAMIEAVPAQALPAVPETPKVMQPPVMLRVAHGGRTTVQTRREMVLQWGEAHAEFTPQEVARAASAKLSSMRATFSLLRGEGAIAPTGAGRWALVRQERKIS